MLPRFKFLFCFSNGLRLYPNSFIGEGIFKLVEEVLPNLSDYLLKKDDERVDFSGAGKSFNDPVNILAKSCFYTNPFLY